VEKVGIRKHSKVYFLLIWWRSSLLGTCIIASRFTFAQNRATSQRLGEQLLSKVKLYISSKKKKGLKRAGGLLSNVNNYVLHLSLR